MIRWARDEARACASVLAATKSTPVRPERIMLLIALPPAPPTPHTTMRGFSSFSWGAFRLIGTILPHLLSPRRRLTPPRTGQFSGRSSESAGLQTVSGLLGPIVTSGRRL